MRPLLLLLLPLLSLWGADRYLFTSFRGNGESGIYFALSADGRTWTPLRGNRPILTPARAGTLMRDPFLTKGPDGAWHLLWTTAWDRAGAGGKLLIGHATSPDLRTWSEQTYITVMAGEPDARNAWAPEAVWDPAEDAWILFWASTIPGRFPESDASGDNGYNHRLYATATRDWKLFAADRLWFDPGFNCIDATVTQIANKRWALVFKDERKTPLAKNLRLATADSASGPWTEISEPFTASWVEGPSVLRLGRDWWIYYDHYTAPRHYGAVRTRDWKHFENADAEVRFPEDHRHGSVVRLTEAEAALLEANP